MTFNSSPGVGFPVILRQSSSPSHTKYGCRADNRHSNKCHFVEVNNVGFHPGIDLNYWSCLRLQFCSAKVLGNVNRKYNIPMEYAELVIAFPDLL